MVLAPAMPPFPEAAPAEPSFDRLVADLDSLFQQGVGEELDESAFNGWALRVFRWQFEHNTAFRGYCLGRGATPATVTSWEDVPAVPTGAFKRLRLLSAGEGREPDAVFHTSGTSRTEQRGEHFVASLRLYRSALLPAFRIHLLPDGALLPVLALVPSPQDAPRSSLSYMIGTVSEAFGAEGGGWFAAADGALKTEGLLRAIEEAVDTGAPVLIAATAFALAHWLDGLTRDGLRFALPEGSRVMETGGFKGRVRGVSRDDLYHGIVTRLGIPMNRVVNEYGMTEMLSQFYEPVLHRFQDSDTGLGDRLHVGPPWVRTRVLDPESLERVPDGEPGILCHHDLANLGSVACLLTEDMGVAVADGFRLLGRFPGAEPRGCSLAIEELLDAAQARGAKAR
jgi:hypothetical protein